MTRSSVRWAVWLRWIRRQDIMGAFMATVFVVFLMSVGLYAMITMHGFRLAGG